MKQRFFSLCLLLTTQGAVITMYAMQKLEDARRMSRDQEKLLSEIRKKQKEIKATPSDELVRVYAEFEKSRTHEELEKPGDERKIEQFDIVKDLKRCTPNTRAAAKHARHLYKNELLARNLLGINSSVVAKFIDTLKANVSGLSPEQLTRIDAKLWRDYEGLGLTFKSKLKKLANGWPHGARKCVDDTIAELAQWILRKEPELGAYAENLERTFKKMIVDEIKIRQQELIQEEDAKHCCLYRFCRYFCCCCCCCAAEE